MQPHIVQIEKRWCRFNPLMRRVRGGKACVGGQIGILTAEIDRRMIAGGKFDLDVVGHYARPDVFQLHVDEREKPTVVNIKG